MKIPAIGLDSPSGWQITSEARLVEPPKAGMSVPLAGKSQTQLPGATISIARGDTGATTAEQALDAFLRYFGEAATGLKHLGRAPIEFADGVRGISTTIAFEPTPGVRVAQRHVYRVDGKVVTHFTISVPERDVARLEAELWAVVAPFQP